MLINLRLRYLMVKAVISTGTVTVERGLPAFRSRCAGENGKEKVARCWTHLLGMPGSRNEVGNVLIVT